ncbi:NACHT, LRR and PYD domains-containing protein 12-like isoform X4, partial [Lates japonicus]
MSLNSDKDHPPAHSNEPGPSAASVIESTVRLEKMSDLDEEQDRAGSPDSDCLSMRSDWSKGLPPVFSNEPSATSVTGLSLRLEMSDLDEEQNRAGSPVSNCLSMKSDRSKGLPPVFSNEPGPSDT